MPGGTTGAANPAGCGFPDFGYVDTYDCETMKTFDGVVVEAAEVSTGGGSVPAEILDTLRRFSNKFTNSQDDPGVHRRRIASVGEKSSGAVGEQLREAAEVTSLDVISGEIGAAAGGSVKKAIALSARGRV